MAKLCFQKTKFISSAEKVEQLPQLSIPEVAVLGRSNVGKSSLLNFLFQQRAMVKTSATPGKTRSLNLFIVDERVAFMDLPGYGFAQVSDSVKRAWAPMVQGYLKKRKNLKVVFFLFDIRREPNDEDRQLMVWMAEQDLAVLLIVTKSDKIKDGQIAARVKQIKAGFKVDNLYAIPVSVLDKRGRQELIAVMMDAIANESEELQAGEQEANVSIG